MTEGFYSKNVLTENTWTSVGPFCDCGHPDRWHVGQCKVEGCGCTLFLQDGSSKLRLSLTHVHRARLVQTGDGLASHFMSAAKIVAHVRGESRMQRLARRYYGDVINRLVAFPEDANSDVPRY